MTFEEDLRKAEYWEKLAIPVISKYLGKKSERRRGHQSYDIIADDGEMFEVKADFAKTGNAFIELTFMERPSGIKTTLATRWLHFDPEGQVVYIFPVGAMKAYLADETSLFADKCDLRRGGNGDNSWGAVIPYGALVKKPWVRKEDVSCFIH